MIFVLARLSSYHALASFSSGQVPLLAIKKNCFNLQPENRRSFHILLVGIVSKKEIQLGDKLALNRWSGRWVPPAGRGRPTAEREGAGAAGHGVIAAR